jgi:tyrosinase
LNNTAVDENTPATPASGYAGSFYIFGHGGCFGGVGHCDAPPPQRPFDFRPGNPLTPITMYVTITSALQRALLSTNEIIVTIVGIANAKTINDKFDVTDILNFKSLEIITYAS